MMVMKSALTDSTAEPRTHRFGFRSLPPAIALGCCLLLAGSGCEPPPAEQEEAVPAPAATFDPATAGTVRGRVSWEGPVPEITPFRVHANRAYAIANQFVGYQPNPHAVKVDAATSGVPGAVVYLRGVDVTRARPWNHADVRVVMRSRTLSILPGAERRIIGFVRRGAAVEFVNEDVTYHLLKARGASVFSLPFVRTDTVTRRQLDQAGLVELTAGAGQFWVRGYLFVDDHPYYALADSSGNFEIRNVPAGDYELVMWLPNWHIERVERDPEVGLVSRVIYRPPLEQVRKIRVEPGRSSEHGFVCSAALFDADAATAR